MNEMIDYYTRKAICENPDNFLDFLECNFGTVILIGICIFCFFLGIAIILNIYSDHKKNRISDEELESKDLDEMKEILDKKLESDILDKKIELAKLELEAQKNSSN